MRVFSVARACTPEAESRTGVPGVLLRPQKDDQLVPVGGFDSIVAVARRGVLVGWAWLSAAIGFATVQDARCAGYADFGSWHDYAARSGR